MARSPLRFTASQAWIVAFVKLHVLITRGNVEPSSELLLQAIKPLIKNNITRLFTILIALSIQYYELIKFELSCTYITY